MLTLSMLSCKYEFSVIACCTAKHCCVCKTTQSLYWACAYIASVHDIAACAPAVQGEYVAPEKIENVYVRCPLVAQSFVYGDSLQPQLVAVVVPDPEALQPWAASRKLTQDLPALCNDPKVNKAILKSMQEEGRAAGLKGFEQVRDHFHGDIKDIRSYVSIDKARSCSAAVLYPLQKSCLAEPFYWYN